jgi:hypothetical protein
MHSSASESVHIIELHLGYPKVTAKKALKRTNVTSATTLINGGRFTVGYDTITN